MVRVPLRPNKLSNLPFKMKDLIQRPFSLFTFYRASARLDYLRGIPRSRITKAQSKKGLTNGDLYPVFRFDPATNQWSCDVAPTSTCRTSVGVAVLDGFLYAVGGQDGINCLDVVER